VAADDVQTSARGPAPVAGARPRALRVQIVTRKPLTHNTRIFKQAAALAADGSIVTVFGVRVGRVPATERREGYDIIRLPSRPPRALVRGALRRPLKRRVVSQPQAQPAANPEAQRRYRRQGNLLRPLSFLWGTIDFERCLHRELLSHPAPDVIHVNDLDALLSGVRLARRHRVPLVYDAQEYYPGIHTYPAWFQRLLNRYERALIRFPQRVIAVNPLIAAEMERRYDRSVDAVVLNCAPYRLATPRGRSLRERLAIPDHQAIVLYSGGLTWDRGLDNCLRAMLELPNAALVLLGEGGLRPELERLARELRVDDRVAFLDFVDHEEVPATIASADVGLIPYENVGRNHYLASPSKLFHYIQAELPIACSDFPFLRSVAVENGAGVALNPSEPSSIASAIRAVIDDPARRARMRAASTVLKERYCWEVEERRFVALYRDVVGSSEHLDAPAPA
jgi:glycosyltransferase involved in cell wall biosynthesis